MGRSIIQWSLLQVIGILVSFPLFHGGWLGSLPLLSAYHHEINHNNNILINAQDPNLALIPPVMARDFLSFHDSMFIQKDQN
jgi:hypothetical protein